MNVTSTFEFLNKTEGRDKFCKMIQYAARFIKFQAQGNNEEVMKAFEGLFQNMSVARKLFRLFKSFNEYVKIVAIQKGKLPDFEKNLQIITRLAFMFYWVFDNLSILIKVKFLTGFDLKQMSRRASKCWLTGIFLSIIVALLELYKATNRQSQLLLSKANASKGDGAKENAEEFEKEMKVVRAARRTQMLNIVKNLGDSITASQSLGYPQRYFGFNFSDGWVGVGGFTSAFITCSQLYK